MARRSAVRIGDLENHLSAWIERARSGEEILICDGDTPIARIVPLRGAEDFSEQEQALAAEGKLRSPRVSSSNAAWDAFWRLPAPKVDASKVLKALRADRDGN